MPRWLWIAITATAFARFFPIATEGRDLDGKRIRNEIFARFQGRLGQLLAGRAANSVPPSRA